MTELQFEVLARAVFVTVRGPVSKLSSSIDVEHGWEPLPGVGTVGWHAAYSTMNTTPTMTLWTKCMTIGGQSDLVRR